MKSSNTDRPWVVTLARISWALLGLLYSALLAAGVVLDTGHVETWVRLVCAGVFTLGAYECVMRASGRFDPLFRRSTDGR